MGETSPPRAVIGHTGDLGSFTCVYWAFPDTESAVVVTNASSVNGDSSNIVAQVLIQALFSLEQEIDLVSIAEQVEKYESSSTEYMAEKVYPLVG